MLSSMKTSQSPSGYGQRCGGNLTISAILPLFKAQINVGWSDDLTASDSSPYGYGVCSRKCDIGIISAVGAQSERWRFRFEDAVDARRHAAKSIGRETLDKNVKAVIEDIGSDVKFIEGFNEVPIQLLSPDLWKVVWSNPWKFEDNILHHGSTCTLLVN